MSQTCLNQSNSISIEREQKFSEAVNEIFNELNEILPLSENSEDLKHSLLITLKTLTGDL